MTIRNEHTGPLELRLGPFELPRSRNGGALPRKNTYFRIGLQGHIYRTKHAKDFVTVLGRASARAGIWPNHDHPPIRSGWWALDLLVVAPTRLRRDVLLPRCDSDACLAPVKDALMYAGIVDDDARIVTDRTWVAYREAAPELRIRLTPVDSPEVALAAVWPDVGYFGQKDRPGRVKGG